MNTVLPVLIMMNNYFHDVATAVLLVCGCVLVALGRVSAETIAKESAVYRIIFKYISRLAAGALAWIIIGGIPRVIFFKRYEWWDAANKGIVPALIAKHAVMTILVLLGLRLWLRLRHTVNAEADKDHQACS